MYYYFYCCCIIIDRIIHFVHFVCNIRFGYFFTLVACQQIIRIQQIKICLCTYYGNYK